MRYALLLACLALPLGAQAHTPPTPVTVACVRRAARAERVPLAALVGLLKVEGGQVGRQHANRNGTFDMGPMQINTIWLAEQGVIRLSDNGASELGSPATYNQFVLKRKKEMREYK
jgi:hypothetical protein